MIIPKRRQLTGLLGRGRPVTWAMAAGGVLWVIHGFLRNLTPLGPDVLWQEDLRYSLILSKELFLLYNLPGVLALILTAWGMLSYMARLRMRSSRLKRAAQILGVLSLVLAFIAAAGQLVVFDPLTTGGLSFGVPVLGAAVFLAGLALSRERTTGEGLRRLLTPGLMLLGAIGMFVLPLRPLMYALELLPLAFGAGVFALLGAGWIILAFTVPPATATAGLRTD